MCMRKVVILIAFERSVCLSISCYYMRFLCVCLSLSFCTCVCLFLRLSFHLKCCARVRLYYNRVPNSGETAENVLVKNDDNSLILCLSFAVVFASVAIVSFTFSFPRGCSSSRATSMEKTTSFFNSSSSRFSSSSGVNGVFWAHSFGYRENVFSVLAFVASCSCSSPSPSVFFFLFKRFLLEYLVLGTNSYVLSVTIFLLNTAFNHSLLFELVSLPSNTSGKHVLNSPNVALSMVSTITSFEGESSLFAITFAKALSSFFFLLVFFVFVVVAAVVLVVFIFVFFSCFPFAFCKA